MIDQGVEFDCTAEAVLHPLALVRLATGKQPLTTAFRRMISQLNSIEFFQNESQNL
jgi:hypothetical protein